MGSACTQGAPDQSLQDRQASAAPTICSASSMGGGGAPVASLCNDLCIQVLGRYVFILPRHLFALLLAPRRSGESTNAASPVVRLPHPNAQPAEPLINSKGVTCPPSSPRVTCASGGIPSSQSSNSQRGPGSVSEPARVLPAGLSALLSRRWPRSRGVPSAST